MRVKMRKPIQNSSGTLNRRSSGPPPKHPYGAYVEPSSLPANLFGAKTVHANGHNVLAVPC